ncbi:MAG: hypothetical protein WKI04_16130 [Ferruginibacter sp.]
MIFDKTSKKLKAVLLVSIPLFAGSCYYDKEELLYPGNNQPPNCATSPASFNADVLPLLLSKCAIPGCHDGAASGGLTFQNYNQVSAAKDRIHTQAVVQNDAANGAAIACRDQCAKCWIEGGLNN